MTPNMSPTPYEIEQAKLILSDNFVRWLEMISDEYDKLIRCGRSHDVALDRIIELIGDNQNEQ